MRKTIRTIAAILLIVSLIAGSGASAFAAGFEGYEPLEHRPLTPSDLQYKGWDDDNFDALLQRLEAMGADTPDSEFLDVYQQILDEYDELYNQYMLADAAYYANVNDTLAAEASDEMFDKRLADWQEEYRDIMRSVAQAKWESYSGGEDVSKRRSKLSTFLASRGYESPEIQALVREFGQPAEELN